MAATPKSARLSVVVPTIGRGPIENLFASMKTQLGPRDEVLVLGDVASGPVVGMAERVKKQGRQYRYVEVHADHHCYGHCVLNAGMPHARGDYLVFNDDDDAFTPGAFAAIRREIGRLEEPRPILFRFKTHMGYVVWTLPRLLENHISGQCLVAPNNSARLGRWTCRYNGDFDFIASTVACYPAGPVWAEDIIAVGRPHLA